MQATKPWKSGVAEPFASDRDFWRSIGASTDALVLLVFATVLVAIFGVAAAVAFVAPLALLVRSGVLGRRSAERSRGQFADPRAWKQAEREAVASVLPRAFIRSRTS